MLNRMWKMPPCRNMYVASCHTRNCVRTSFGIRPKYSSTTGTNVVITNAATFTAISALSAVEMGPGPREDNDEPYEEERRMFSVPGIVSLAEQLPYARLRHLDRFVERLDAEHPRHHGEHGHAAADGRPQPDRLRRQMRAGRDAIHRALNRDGRGRHHERRHGHFRERRQQGAPLNAAQPPVQQ